MILSQYETHTAGDISPDCLEPELLMLCLHSRPNTDPQHTKRSSIHCEAFVLQRRKILSSASQTPFLRSVRRRTPCVNGYGIDKTQYPIFNCEFANVRHPAASGGCKSEISSVTVIVGLFIQFKDLSELTA